jgi:cytidylate kinase
MIAKHPKTREERIKIREKKKAERAVKQTFSKKKRKTADEVSFDDTLDK